MQFRVDAIVLSIAAAVALAACGGGGGASPTSSPSVKTALSGKVVDGYIEGATVCLDLNADQACGAGEPSATSKADGSYSLDITGLTTAQIQATHLFTIVPLTAKDADDAGKTLAEAGKSAFNMMAPAIAYVSADGSIASAVISPLTTMLSHELITRSGTPLAHAEAALRTRLGLPEATDLRKDFVATLDSKLAQQARVMAVAIGEIKKSALGISGTSDRDAFMAALQYLDQNAPALQSATVTVTPGTVADMVKTALQQTDLLPNPATLIAAAMQVTNTTSNDSLSIFADGFYNPLLFTGSPGVLGYTHVAGVNGQWQSGQLFQNAGNWVARTDYPTHEFSLLSQGWVAATGSYWAVLADNAGTVTPDDQGGVVVASANGYKYRLRTRSLDVSGRPVASVAGLVGYLKSIGSPASVQSTIFGTNSKVFFGTATQIEDEYTIQTIAGSEISIQNPSNNVVTKLPSIVDLISAYSTSNANANHQFLDLANSRHISFDDGGSATGGTVSIWGSCGSIACEKIGSRPYVIKTVYGQQVLVVDLPAYDVVTVDMEGNVMPSAGLIFSAKDGKVFAGKLTLAATAPEASRVLFTNAAMNALLAADGKQAVAN